MSTNNEFNPRAYEKWLEEQSKIDEFKAFVENQKPTSLEEFLNDSDEGIGFDVQRIEYLNFIEKEYPQTVIQDGKRMQFSFHPDSIDLVSELLSVDNSDVGEIIYPTGDGIEIAFHNQDESDISEEIESRGLDFDDDDIKSFGAFNFEENHPAFSEEAYEKFQEMGLRGDLPENKYCREVSDEDLEYDD